VVADMLSRPAAAVASPADTVVDFKLLVEAQSTCSEIEQLARDSSLQIVELTVAGARLLCDKSTGVLRPLVPASQKRAVFIALHGIAHPGVRATRRIVSARYMWRSCTADISTWCRECPGCARGKTTVHCQPESATCTWI
jgi:hypothetical protein